MTGTDVGLREAAPVVRIGVARLVAPDAEMKPAGVIVPAEFLETKPWGTRQFNVRDCRGNRVTFVEAT